VEVLLTITPSMIYRGSELPFTVLALLNLTLIPDAGSPEFCVTCTPANFPESAPETSTVRDSAIFDPDTVETVFPNCFLLSSREPVTTISSSCNTSSASWKSTVTIPLVSVRVLRSVE